MRTLFEARNEAFHKKEFYAYILLPERHALFYPSLHVSDVDAAHNLCISIDQAKRGYDQATQYAWHILSETDSQIYSFKRPSY